MASSADQQITQMLKKQEKELSDLQSLIDKHEDSDSTAYQVFGWRKRKEVKREREGDYFFVKKLEMKD